MTLSELRKKRTKLWDQAKSYLDSHTHDGLISDEHAAVYDKMEGEIVSLGKQIERLERRHDLDDAMSAPTSKPLYSTPGTQNSGRSTNEYSRAFWNALRGRGVTNVLSEGIDTSGGFLVPEEFSNKLIEALTNQNIFRQICRIVSTSREKLKVPVAVASGTASWVEENAAIPESDSTFGQVILNAYKLGTLMRASTELIEDSAFNIQSYIAQEFGRRIGACEEEAFAIGDGSGKPTGIFAATGGAPVGVTAADANITFDNIIDLYHALRSPYRAKAVFVTNDSTLKVLRKLKSSDGLYLWQPSVKDGYPDTVLGKAVYTSPFVPALAAGNSPIAFGDFSYYWIADRRDTRFKVLNEKYAEQDQIGFFATERVDGKLILTEAVQLLQIGS
ncbi:phage major capsid protein [Eubacteriales bacterium OttesenSCG-928-G02]|nr:phage major capsid protein [Eubacteriales bacterium OttesenSCG-928-G02]